MRAPRTVATFCLVLSGLGPGSVPAQSDLPLTIHAGSPDFLTLVGGAGGAPVDLVRLLRSSPGAADDGALQGGAGTAPTQCTQANGVAVHPNGRFVYLAAEGTPAGMVCAYEYVAATNTLLPVVGSPFPAGRGTRALAVDPAGKYVYATNFVDGSISGYSVNGATGALNPLGASPYVSADSSTGHIVIDPLGRFVYTTNSDAIPSVSGFAIDRDTGGLTPVPLSPVVLTSVPGALAIDPRGRYLFVSATPGMVYAINAATGQLTATGHAFGGPAEGMAVDPSGRYLYAASGTGAASRLDGYRIAGNAVVPVQSVLTGNQPRGIAVARTGRHVYTANRLDGTVSGFRIDDATGALAPLPGSPFPGGENPTALAAFGALETSTTWRAGEALARPIGVFGGRFPYLWAVTQGSLPPGLAFLPELGMVAGVPTATGSYAFTARVTEAYGGTASRAFTLTIASDATPAVVTVIEYYNAALDHYFITWIGDEIAKLDAGVVIKGWQRTGRAFAAYATAQAGTSPICRYYIPPELGDSHFFGRGTAECDATGAAHPTFVLEDPAFMHMLLPAAGTCPASSTPVYRVFSNRPDANHRYMTDSALRDEMATKGWLPEGDGPDLVVMCAPA